MHALRAGGRPLGRAGRASTAGDAPPCQGGEPRRGLPDAQRDRGAPGPWSYWRRSPWRPRMRRRPASRQRLAARLSLPLSRRGQPATRRGGAAPHEFWRLHAADREPRAPDGRAGRPDKRWSRRWIRCRRACSRDGPGANYGTSHGPRSSNYGAGHGPRALNYGAGHGPRAVPERRLLHRRRRGGAQGPSWSTWRIFPRRPRGNGPLAVVEWQRTLAP